MLKNIAKLLLVLAVLVLVGLFGLTYYLEQHKQDLFAKFETWYHENHHGTLAFEDVAISTFKNFPNVAIAINNLSISDSISAQHNTQTLTVNELRLLFSIQDVLKKEVELKAIKIEDGSLNIITEKDGATNKGLFFKKRKDSLNAKNENWLKENKLNLSIENFEVAMYDYQKNKRITALVNEIDSDMTFEETKVISDLSMDVQMYEMGLNLTNGTFFNNANVKASFKATFLPAKDSIKIPKFQLFIDDQEFLTTAKINTVGAGTFNFSLENNATNFRATSNLLSQNIQKSLNEFNIKEPIYIYGTLQGSFKYRSNPLVKVWAATKNNTVIVGDSLQINNAEFRADFVNRIYDDARMHTESPKNLRINLNEFNGFYDGILINFNKAKIKSTPEVKKHLDVDISLTAKTEKLNTLLNSDEFLFTEGKFNLNTKFKGAFEDVNSIIDKTDSELLLDNTKLVYVPHTLEIPIDTLLLSVHKKHGYLKRLKVPINDSKHSLFVKGSVKNVSALVFEKEEKASSEFEVYSNALVWEDFIALFKIANQQVTKKEKQDLLYLNEALKAIYKKINPKLSLKIQEFQYQNFKVNKLKAGLYFKNINSIDLQKTGFEYRKGLVGMNLNLDISKPNETFFKVDFLADKIDLGNLLKEFNYFNLKALKEADNIEGITSLEVDMSGSVSENSGLDTNSLKGTVNFDFEQVALSDFKPIQEVANKLFKKERFEHIKFAPIKTNIFIENRSIFIPQTEIRSTAFDLFLEGELNYDNKTNIWVAVPLENFKKRKNLNEIPPKTGYTAAGKKVFVQAKDKGNGELDYKFHFNNKKQYEEKGIIEQYKEDKKAERQARRLLKKTQAREGEN